MHIVQETPDDWWEVEALYDLSFAPGREALSSYRLRDDVPPVKNLCLVARDDDGTLAGAIRYWPAQIKGSKILLLGPIAVHPTRQGEGVAARLISQSLDIARQGAVPRVLLVGDAPYYERFGFRRSTGILMPPPTNPHRILICDLVPGAWDGLKGKVGKLSSEA